MYKKYYFIISIISIIVIESCRPAIDAKVTSMKFEENNLNIHFNFYNKRDFNNPIEIETISIYRNDSLILQMSGKENLIKQWDFPSIPQGFQIDSSIIKNKIPNIQKNEEIYFQFSNTGYWLYNPIYFKNSWMLDSLGAPFPNVGYGYDNWVGKDVIYIYTNKDFKIIDSLFCIETINNIPIKYELKYKKNPTNCVIILVDYKPSKNEKIILKAKLDSKMIINDTLILNSKEIGILGKKSYLYTNTLN